jgi:hypothetical protein
MGVRVTADGVSACGELAHRIGVQKAGLPNTAGDDEELPT